MIKYNFAELDSRLSRIWYKDDLFKALESMKYKYVSEFVYDRYVVKKEFSSNIGKLVERSGSCIRSWVIVFGFKLRKVGGNIHNPKLDEKGYKQKIIDSWGKMNSTEAAKKFKCSRTIINQLWKKQRDGERVCNGIR